MDVAINDSIISNMGSSVLPPVPYTDQSRLLPLRRSSRPSDLVRLYSAHGQTQRHERCDIDDESGVDVGFYRVGGLGCEGRELGTGFEGFYR